MATAVWRFSGDITTPGNTDPDVQVFLGETYSNDTTGDHVFYKDMMSPLTMKLSELPAFLANPTVPAEHKIGTPGTLIPKENVK